MTTISIKGAPELKTCPFKKSKKRDKRTCSGSCALYVGAFPSGDCAIYIAAKHTISNTEEKQEKF